MKLNILLEVARGISYYKKTRKYDIVHFDQVLKSFGFLSFITFLKFAKMANKRIVVTVHEIDPFQEEHQKFNRYYNNTDKVIVHSEDLKEEMVGLGVKKELINVVPYGVSLSEIKGCKRDQFIFFGGHKLLKGKGFDVLLSALQILSSKKIKIKLVIYTGEGCVGLKEGIKMASNMGLDEFIVWSEFLYGTKLVEAYQRSIGCLIPFTGGSARYPVTNAMANATPVIATKKASLPEYLGELGIYVKEDSAEELADAIIKLIDEPDVVVSLGANLRKRAEENFGWNVIAKKTYKIYNQLNDNI